MDEFVVLDLLDCPVCLGKLDVTAKVLPCQHTFCQPCLQRLFKGKKELRCPECRTPVFCSIEELPANLLLVRLLEGLRGGKSIVRKNSLQRMGGLFAQDAFKKSREHKANHEPSPRLFPKAMMPVEEMPCAKALSNYRGHAPNDLTFNKGDIIVLHRQLDQNWYHGEVNGGTGIFPASTVKILHQLQEPPALCKALYNFDLKDKERGENKNCLKFVKDDIISVIRRVDDNWAEGKLRDQVGIFPLLFVEPNHTAKQLLESNKGKRNNGIRVLSPLKKTSSKTKASESTANHRMPEGRRKSPRQFLITNALNTFNKMVHSPAGRQTPEISTPVLISSSNTAVIEKAEPLSNSPFQASASLYYSTLGSQSPRASLAAFPNSQQTIIANMCVVLHPYIAHGPEEMDLQKGEGVRILGKFQEGWLRGVSLVTGKIGIFPSHCVNPVYRKSPNYSDQRLPSHQTSWNSSSASVSSQSSVSEHGVSRPVRSFFVPTAVVAPIKKSTTSASAMRNVQSSPVSLALTSNTRSPSAIVQPQPIQIFQNASQSNVGTGAGTMARQIMSYDTLTLLGRGIDYRRYSTTSSVNLEPKDSFAKNELPAKPASFGPPSILVKPDTPKSASEKQVKTVRFMNFSPPTLKRQSSQSRPDGRSEQSIEPLKQEATPSPESILLAPPPPARAGSTLVQPTESKRVHKLKSVSNDLVLSTPSKMSFASKRLNLLHKWMQAVSNTEKHVGRNTTACEWQALRAKTTLPERKGQYATYMHRSGIHMRQLNLGTQE
ncbi:E3 ubiquitin-protein ligase SH3RF2 [Rhinophrynus dorsalis]